MKISKIHQRFSEKLKEPRALTNPEDFLGPNWRDVINFWLFIDTLSEEEKYKMNKCYWALDIDVRVFSGRAAMIAAMEVVGEEVKNEAWYANSWRVFRDATLELIASHKLLEQNKTPLALQHCIKFSQ